MQNPRIRDTVRWFKIGAGFFSLILFILFLMILGAVNAHARTSGDPVFSAARTSDTDPGGRASGIASPRHPLGLHPGLPR